MVKVKICGITNLKDALAAAKWGADALGFIFAPSPRRITPQQAASIIAELPPFISKVGVFVDSELQEIRETMAICGLDLAQLHGLESPEYCQALSSRAIKSFRVKDESVLELLNQYKVKAFLLDNYDAILKGGTGKIFDWNIARKAAQDRLVILSGGLTAANVRQAINKVKPYAVDVSSGVESSPGVKDHSLLQSFLEVVKGN